MRVRTEAEVLDCLTRVLGTPKEDNVRASGRTEGKLVEGDALAAGLLDPGAGSGGEAQSADGHLGQRLGEAVVVGDRADNGPGLALICLSGVLVRGDGNNLRQTDRGPVDLA